MSNLLNQALVYTTMLNTVISKSNATPIGAKTNMNVERRQKKSSCQFTFFENQLLKCFYSPLTLLKNVFKTV